MIEFRFIVSQYSNETGITCNISANDRLSDAKADLIADEFYQFPSDIQDYSDHLNQVYILMKYINHENPTFEQIILKFDNFLYKNH